MRRVRDYLTVRQERDGHWCAELTRHHARSRLHLFLALAVNPPLDGDVGKPETRPLIANAVHSS